MSRCKDVQARPLRTPGRPFASQQKGCSLVTDIVAGRGIGTDNRSARGGSLKRVQSDPRGVLGQRAPALRSFGLVITVNEHRRDGGGRRGCAGASKDPVRRRSNRRAGPFCAPGHLGSNATEQHHKKKSNNHATFAHAGLKMAP